MKNDILKCQETLKTLVDNIEVKDLKGTAFDFATGLEDAINLILERSQAGNKLMFIGNGASASISSHIATDFMRNLGIKATAFNDASGLTCISNDYGYKHVFEKPIEIFAENHDILVAISSSGRSENILQAVKAAKKKGVSVITLSGFAEDNPLSQMGDINFYVASPLYGHVEVVHHFICHSMIDVILAQQKGEK